MAISLTLLWFVATVSIFGQQPRAQRSIPAGSTDGGYYTFAPSNHINCLWRVGGPDWEKIYTSSQNDLFHESGRRYERGGVVYVVVHPGERIFVPPSVKTRVDLEPIPTNNIVSAPAFPTLSQGPALPTAPRHTFFLIIVLAIDFLLIAFATWRYRKYRVAKEDRKKVALAAEQKRLAALKKPLPQGHISLVGLNKATVLAALYNASKPQGMGFIHYDPKPMTTEQAREILNSGQTYFDYLAGRVMKIDLSKDELNPWGYDRDNGQDTAQRVIDGLKRGDNTNSVDIQALHAVSTKAAAKAVMAHIHEPSARTVEGGALVLTMGFADVADHLIPKVEGFAEDE
jgi:hypothetical protein